jgi:DNA repair exonuclease SbcCD ATPase subunit
MSTPDLSKHTPREDRLKEAKKSDISWAEWLVFRRLVEVVMEKNGVVANVDYDEIAEQLYVDTLAHSAQAPALLSRNAELEAEIDKLRDELADREQKTASLQESEIHELQSIVKAHRDGAAKIILYVKQLESQVREESDNAKEWAAEVKRLREALENVMEFLVPSVPESWEGDMQLLARDKAVTALQL